MLECLCVVSGMRLCSGQRFLDISLFFFFLIDFFCSVDFIVHHFFCTFSSWTDLGFSPV